jgi:hypothetical protein
MLLSERDQRDAVNERAGHETNRLSLWLRGTPGSQKQAKEAERILEVKRSSPPFGQSFFAFVIFPIFWAIASIESITHLLYCLLLHRCQDMTIHPSRDITLAMPQQCLYHLRRHTHPQQDGCGTLPQVMKAHQDFGPLPLLLLRDETANAICSTEKALTEGYGAPTRRFHDESKQRSVYVRTDD